MFAVLTCIHHDHDLRLVALAALICIVSSVTAFRFHARTLKAGRISRWAWVAATAAVAGSGVWATHFIAMVAYQPDMPIAYQFWGTAASLLPAVLGMGLGFGLASWRRSLSATLAGGAIAGISIATMHYVGIAAVRAPAQIVWDQAYVVASIAISMLGGMAAFAAASRTQRLMQWIAPPGLMVLAICGLHFTAMTAIRLAPDPTSTPLAELMSRGALASLTGTVAAFILLSAITLITIEAQTHQTGLKRLRAAFEAVPAGLAMYDRTGRLALWNRTYHDVVAAFGVEPAIGAPRTAMLRAIATSGWIDAAAGREAEWAAELDADRNPPAQELRLKNGRWLRLEVCPISDGGVVTAFTDVSDLKSAAATISAERDRAETANRSKSEFLANMSHEIRTPLNGVVAAADILWSGELDAKGHDLVDIIRSSAANLQCLLTDILDLARIESGRVAVESTTFHVGDMVRSIAALSKLHADEKGVAVGVSVAPDLDRLAVGDPVRVRQILTNLVGNAVKFTDCGQVSIHATWLETGLARFEVRDTGIGFDPAMKDKLFGRFQQADGSITRKFGGSGLGLTISRDLAELMGGSVGCDSIEGVGSKFWLDLPLQLASGTEPALAAEVTASEQPRDLRALLADDHPTNRKVVELILADVAEFVSVENGADAVEAFERGSFDVVLMDMQMPVMDGLMAVRQIRRSEAERGLPRTPVIMLTANAMPEHVEASRAAGADLHLGKPITAHALLTALDQALAAEDRQAAEVAA